MLSAEEQAELANAFAHVINYGSDDPTEPIDPLTYVAPEGDTCLHIAALAGNFRAVQLLVREGLDVNAKGDMGYTPLQYALTAEIVQFLLASGADSSIVNEFGRSPVGWLDK
jgi:ankyrin repeat protein